MKDNQQTITYESYTKENNLKSLANNNKEAVENNY